MVLDVKTKGKKITSFRIEKKVVFFTKKTFLSESMFGSLLWEGPTIKSIKVVELSGYRAEW